jgi:hypothetical protein
MIRKYHLSGGVRLPEHFVVGGYDLRWSGGPGNLLDSLRGVHVSQRYLIGLLVGGGSIVYMWS